ncbi:MAG TPA: hypothetical protein VGM64_17645 [Lacunisphaera sp.]|jgi:hypothetical protein
MKLDASHFRRSEQIAAFIGLAALVPGVILAWRFPSALAPAWRCAVLIGVGPAIGSLVFGTIQQMTGGVWAQDLRAFLLAGIRLLPWMWLLTLPLLGERLREPIAGTGFGYATPAAFALRTVLYGAVFFLLSRWMQKAWPKSGRAVGLGWVGPTGAIVLFFMTHLLADDWLASLDPHWHSTAFPVVWLCGQAVTGLAVAIICALFAGGNPAQPVGYRRFLGIDWGSLLFATAMFWCYVAFAQYLIVWSGNLPEEALWYTRRMHGFWRCVPLTLVAVEFLAPLIVLLSRRAKQKRRPLAIVAIVLAGGQSLHTAWMVLGAFPDSSAATPWLALVLICAVGGLFINRYLALARKEIDR